MAKVKLSEFFNSLAKKAKIDENDKILKEILAIPELTTMEIPEEFAGHMDRNLIAFEDAKKHPDIRKVMFAEVNDAIDANIMSFAPEFGLTDTETDPIKKEGKTLDKIKSMLKTVQSLTEKKFKTADGTTAEKLNQTIIDLNKKLSDAEIETQNKITAKEAEHSNDLIDRDISGLMNDYSWALKEVPKTVNVKTAKTLLNEKLSEKKLKIVRDGENLVLRTAEGTPYFDEKHNEVALKSFLDGTISGAKLIAASDGGNGSGEKGKKITTEEPGAGKDNKNTPDESVINNSSSALSEFMRNYNAPINSADGD